jgi:uncharacterized protein
MKLLSHYKSAADMPATIPVFPLTGALLLPRTELPLNIFEPRYLQMFDDAMRGPRIIGMIQPKHGDQSDVPKLSTIGCAGRVTSYTETHDGRLLVTITGVSRFEVKSEMATTTPYRIVEASFDRFQIDFVSGNGAKEVNRSAVLKAFRDYLEANDMTTNWDEIEAVNTESLVNTLSLMAPYPAPEKQALLEAKDLKMRADMLVALTELALARQRTGKKPTVQ